ncbi:hypothetical protein [Shewanella halifaxensis]|uniref:hypothetical protein n=1 Tax=Shewanella halifaxensis TaxID=271098 RepID=UPI000D59E476|nr:hypothetical protein [Shewanella halifaxensis]
MSVNNRAGVAILPVKDLITGTRRSAMRYVCRGDIFAFRMQAWFAFVEVDEGMEREVKKGEQFDLFR